MDDQALWSSAEAERATGESSRSPWTATGVSIDSRTTGPGDLFVALSGPNFDGHDFVNAAFEQGAAAAVVAHARSRVADDKPLLVVDDPHAALQALGRHARQRTTARIIAVTGSVGKTGTKEALALAFGAHGRTHATRGNLNNDIGVPLSLARMPRDTEFAIFELGMNHAGEIRELSKLVRPEVAIITTIAAAHLEFFDSVAAIAEAKAEIFAGIVEDGVAILNRDNAYYALLITAAWEAGVKRVLGFGEHPEAEALLAACDLDASSSSVEASINGMAVRYGLPVAGRHWVMNTLAVLAAVDVVGGSVERAAQSFADLAAPKGRGASRKVSLGRGSIELIDDSYNAGPASMRAAFAVLGKKQPSRGGRRIAVLGDMLELGASSELMHAALARDLQAADVDLVFTAGEMMAALDAALPAAMRGGHAPRSENLRGMVLAALRSGDVVLVKGSLGSRMGLVAEAIGSVRPTHRPSAVCV